MTTAINILGVLAGLYLVLGTDFNLWLALSLLALNGGILVLRFIVSREPDSYIQIIHGNDVWRNF